MKPIFLPLFAFCISISANAQWSEIGRSNAWAICADTAGNVYASGAWAGGVVFGRNHLAKWDGISWVPLDSANMHLPDVNSTGNDFNHICLDSLNNVYTAGDLRNSNGKYYVAKWNGAGWSEVGTGINSLSADSSIDAICFDRAGNLYAAGDFRNSNGKRYVAKWDGTSWSELGTGSNSLGANARIRIIRADNDGNVYAGGYFTNSNGKYYVAKWDGIAWSELGGTGANSLNADGRVNALCIDNTGNVYAGGRFRNSNNMRYIAKWDGSSWSQVGGGGGDTLGYVNNINFIDMDPLGNIYAGVEKTRPAFSYGNFYVIKWDGTSWSELGGTHSLQFDDDINLCLDGRGNLYAVSAYKPGQYYYIAKYSGAYNVSYTTAQDGNWNNPFTWQGGVVPPANAIVIIRHNVSVNVNTTCYSVTMQPGGNVTVASGIQFTVLH